jgi:DNA helicase-2/ATP-dependent DNA helicase PcrA
VSAPRDKEKDGFRILTAAELGAVLSETPSAAANLDAMRPGAVVLHPKYGLGRITALEGAGPDRKGRVAFSVGGERTFLLAKAGLRVVGRNGPVVE